MWRVVWPALMAAGVLAQYYDTFTGQPTSERRVEQLRRDNLVPWCAVEVKKCDPHERRRVELTCNNLRFPSFGGSQTPFLRLLPPQYGAGGGLPVARTGNPLPNARRLRVALIPDAKLQNKVFTNLITGVAVFITGDITSVHDTVNYVSATTTCCAPRVAGDAGEAGSSGSTRDPRCMPVRVADDDPYLRETDVRCLNLTRSITYQALGCVPRDLPGERVNTAPPMLELSIVYGSIPERLMDSREQVGGRLRVETERGREWPPRVTSPVSLCLLNRRPAEDRCHESPSPSTNTLLPINLIFLWFYRFHNILAKELQELNPCWDDDQLFYTAREINIAVFLKIVYYEWAPMILGYDYLVKNKIIFPDQLHVDDYDDSLEPKVSIEFVVANRWFHTLQQGTLNLYNKHGQLFSQVSAVDLTLRTGALPINSTIEGLTQGLFRQPCSSADYTIDTEMGERSLSSLQRVSDVLTADIMKGRDMGLPPYGRYRELCRLPAPRAFKHLYQWMPKHQASVLAALYEHVSDVELFVGLLSERPLADAAVGPTLACLLADQLVRWRRADRFWFESPARPAPFTAGQLTQVRRMSLARLMCEVADDVDAVQPNPFLLPGAGNEITDCKLYQRMNLEPWRDHGCSTEDRHHLYERDYFWG